MVDELLGHKSDVTSRVYIKLGALDVKQQLIEEHAAAIDGMLRRKNRKRIRSRVSNYRRADFQPAMRNQPTY